MDFCSPPYVDIAVEFFALPLYESKQICVGFMYIDCLVRMTMFVLL